MKLIWEEDCREQTAQQIALLMASAARTAPKARGTDNLVIVLADSETRQKIAEHMRVMESEGRGAPFFLRDAQSIEKSDALLIIGTKITPLGIDHCGLCGFSNCEEKRAHPEHPCAFNIGDMGIAVGSAVSIALEHRIDNRIMFSAGMAIRDLHLLDPSIRIIQAIPLSISKKNIFFDRAH